MDRTVYEACSDLIVEYGSHRVSADEVLLQKVGELVPIPFKTREDLESATTNDRKDGLFSGDLVPRIDLRILHYFATQLCLQKYPHLLESFDETSMLTLGLLVEQWVKDYLVNSDDEFSPGSAQCVSKVINYRDYPGNI